MQNNSNALPQQQEQQQQPTSRAQQPVHIRSSCDSCSEAKVKCSKERPACQRCATNDLRCVYGVSRRHGCKRGRVKTSTTSGQKVGAQSRGQEGRQMTPTAAWSTFDQQESPAASRRSSVMGLTFSATNSDLDGGEFIPESHADVTANFLRNTTLDDAASIMDWDALMSPPLFEPADSRKVQASGPWTPFSADVLLPNDVSGVHKQHPRPSTNALSFNDASTTDLMSSGIFVQNEPTPPDEYHNHCEMEALQVMNSLYGGEGDLTQTNKSMERDPNLFETRHSLDSVLHKNKRALQAIKPIWQCSCIRTPQLMALLMSITSRMIALYDVAATSLTDTGYASRKSSNSSEQDVLAAANQTKLVKVGTFSLDDEDQISLQRSIILRELGKLNSFLAEELASLQNHGLSSSDLMLQHWHSVTISLLKSKLKATIECVERHLTSGRLF